MNLTQRSAAADLNATILAARDFLKLIVATI